jgi:hypothetical protein
MFNLQSVLNNTHEEENRPGRKCLIYHQHKATTMGKKIGQGGNV